MAREHIRAFAALSNAKIAGIASRTRSRAQELADEFGIPLVCESLEELYERSSAHLCVVTVSAESMLFVARQCFSFPWDVLLEKPPGYDLEQATCLAAASRDAAGKVFVGLNRRFMSSTLSALDDLNQRSGPRHIQVLDQLDSRFTASFGHPPEILSRLMFFSSIHLIDYFRVFGRGPVQSVHPLLRWNPIKPWIVAAEIRFGSGDTGLYQAVWNAPGPWSVAVCSPEVRWDIRPLERATYQLAGSRLTSEVEVSEFDKEFKPGFRFQAEQAVAAVLGQASNIPTLDDALQTMRLIDQIYAQTQNGTGRPPDVAA